VLTSLERRTACQMTCFSVGREYAQPWPTEGILRVCTTGCRRARATASGRGLHSCYTPVAGSSAKHTTRLGTYTPKKGTMNNKQSNTCKQAFNQSRCLREPLIWAQNVAHGSVANGLCPGDSFCACARENTLALIVGLRAFVVA
jgi:hypothetical protein